jgi:DNA-binding transcriptional regulator YhcF (GntR family)
MVPARLAPVVRTLKYTQVAAYIRAQIDDGLLTPGGPVPSGAALSRVTGYSVLTCRRALRILVDDGVLVPGTSPGARPRVPASTLGEQTLASAARALSAALAICRRSAGLTQLQLAKLVGVSVTTIGHAETGRVWQSRPFWEHADKELNADGELLALHDAYRAANAGTVVEDAESAEVESGGTETQIAAGLPSAVEVAASGPVSCVTITWADGSVTTVYPPQLPARPAEAIPVNWPRG